LNRLISIAKAQDIHVGISNEEAKFCREIPPQQNSAATKFCRKQFRRKNSAANKIFLSQERFYPLPQVRRTKLRELVAEINWKRLGWVLKKIEKNREGTNK
jgi:hypothetical protein